MSTGKITRQEHSEDERRRDEIEEGFAPRSMRRFSSDPSVKPLRNTELVVVDDGTTRYLAFRLDGDLFKVLATASGDFVKLEGDTMSGQLGSTVAPGAPPFVVTSTDKNVNLNADQVDGFDHDQSLLTTNSPEFVSVEFSALSASRLMRTSAGKVAASVTDLTVWIGGTANQVVIADDGDGTITISTPQDIHTGASPTFVGVTLSGAAASRLMATDGAKALGSVADLTTWVAGTVNQVVVTDDGDGTITLSLPQDIHTGASPTFDGITLTGPTILEPDVVSVTAAGGITVTASHMHVSGDGGAIDITADPQIAAGANGQIVLIEGGSDTNTVKLDHGEGLHLHGGSYTLRNHDYILMNYDGTENEWQEITRSATASEKSWPFLSQVAGSGTNYFGGFYIFNSGNSDFTATQTLGVANASYAAHLFLVLGANTDDDLTIRVSGTSIDDEGNRTGSDTEDIVFSHPALTDDYAETAKKWIGQVSIDHISGTAKDCNWGFDKYWDNQNTDFIVLGLEATWRGGANDADPDLQLIHHKSTGWTYNAGSTPTPPTPLASMKTDHTPEYLVRNNVPGAWKRTDLNTEVNGGDGEGTIFAMVTNNNKTFEAGNVIMRVRPN